MAIIHVCDGCGAQGKDFAEAGVVKKVQVCVECEPVYRDYLAEIDALQETLAKRFQVQLQKIRTAFAKDHPDWVLPDA